MDVGEGMILEGRGRRFRRAAARRSKRLRAGLAAFLVMALAGCSGVQSVLETGSRESAEVATLFWVMVGVTTPILLLVTVLAVWPFVPRWRRPAVPGRAFVLGGGLGLPAIVLPLFTFWSYEIGVRPGPAAPPELVVEVVGHKFWWEVHYRIPGEDWRVTSANEIRLPVGRRVSFEVTASDVIHSFWVPALGGKIDMIPGRVNVIQVTPERAGVLVALPPGRLD